MSMLLSTKSNLHAAADMLMRIAETNDVEQLDSVLAVGVDVDATNEFGTTALMRACASGRLLMAQALLRHGADPNRARNDTFTALALAAFFGYEEIVKLLIEHGAQKHASTRFDTSPRMWATARAFWDVAQYLSQTQERQSTKSTNSAGPAAPACVAEVTKLDPLPPIPTVRSVSRPFRLKLAPVFISLLIISSLVGISLRRNQKVPQSSTPSPLGETAPTTPPKVVERTVSEPSKNEGTPLTAASINLNHHEDTKPVRSAPVSNPPIRKEQRRVRDVAVDEPSAIVQEEPKNSAASAAQTLSKPPVAVTVKREPSSVSKPAPMTNQLLSSPKDSEVKRKVIQWP